eukprot:5447032-Amphidinium_carterae.1
MLKFCMLPAIDTGALPFQNYQETVGMNSIRSMTLTIPQYQETKPHMGNCVQKKHVIGEGHRRP